MPTWPEDVDILVILAIVPAKGYQLRRCRVGQQAEPLARYCRAWVDVHLQVCTAWRWARIPSRV